MAIATYSTVNDAGIDINTVFYLDVKSFPEYPGPPFALGTQAWGTDGSYWSYCQASVTIGAGNVVLISPIQLESGNATAWTAAPIGGTVAAASVLTGTFVGVVGGSVGTMVVGAPSGTQTAAYFWVQRAGNAPNVTCTATATQYTLLHSVAATPGAVTAAAGGSGTTYQIAGMVITNAIGSVAGPNTACLNWPTVGAAN